MEEKAIQHPLITDLKKELDLIKGKPSYFKPEFIKGYEGCISDALICLKDSNNYAFFQSAYENGYAAGRNGLHNADLQEENKKLREALKQAGEKLEWHLYKSQPMELSDGPEFDDTKNVIQKIVVLSQPKEETK